MSICVPESWPWRSSRRHEQLSLLVSGFWLKPNSRNVSYFDMCYPPFGQQTQMFFFFSGGLLTFCLTPHFIKSLSSLSYRFSESASSAETSSDFTLKMIHNNNHTNGRGKEVFIRVRLPIEWCDDRHLSAWCKNSISTHAHVKWVLNFSVSTVVCRILRPKWENKMTPSLLK